MGTYKGSNAGTSNIYEILPQQLAQDTGPPTRGEKVINDLLQNIVPKKDLDSCFKERKHDLYMNLKKFIPPKKKAPARVKKTYLSRKEKSKLGLLKCPKNGWNYSDLDSLRQMWKEHMYEVLNIVVGDTPKDTELINFNRLMTKADLHGSEMEIVKSRNPNMIGIKGTCVIDARDTFGIVTQQNRYLTIPKDPCVFKIILDNLNITIFGKYLLNRSAERSVKKIKSFMVPKL